MREGYGTNVRVDLQCVRGWFYFRHRRPWLSIKFQCVRGFARIRLAAKPWRGARNSFRIRVWCFRFTMVVAG